MINVYVEICREGVELPRYANLDDSGMDVRAAEDITIEPQTTVIVPTGLKMAIPKGYEIHHIDGNRKNNSIDNLQLVTIEEHLEIHKREDNLGAVQAILWRMNNVDKKELSEVARTVQKRLLKEGKHNFQKFDRVQMSKEIIEKRLSEGKPAFLGIDGFVENGRKAGLKAKEKKAGFLNTKSENHGSKHVKGTCWWINSVGERKRSKDCPGDGWKKGMTYYD